MFRLVTTGVYVLSCRLTSGPLWLRIYLFLWWFLLALFGLFVLHWRYELSCQDKLPEFHYTPILGCIRVFWLVFHPLGLKLDKALFGWNSVTDDPILDFVSSQCHSSEDLDQALQAYQAYQVPCSQDSTPIPERNINLHYTYHVAQASQAKHSSLVDRQVNGGLAGSDVRIFSRSSRKCTVTGIDSHELQGLDVVQCAALVETMV